MNTVSEGMRVLRTLVSLLSVAVAGSLKAEDYRPSDVSEVSGGFEVLQGQRYVLDNQTVFDAAKGVSVTNNGELALWNVGGKITGIWTGTGAVDVRTVDEIVISEDYIGEDTFGTVVVPGLRLSEIKSVDCKFGGKSCPGGADAKGYFYSKDETFLKYQMQAIRGSGDEAFLVGVRIRFRERNGNVLVTCDAYPRIIKCNAATKAIIAAGGVRLGMDMYDVSFTKDVDYTSANFATSESVGGYGCHGLKIVLAKDRTIELSGLNAMTGGATLFSAGSELAKEALVVSSTTALPTNGVLTVGAGAETRLAAPGKANGRAYAGDSCQIRILTNGVLKTVHNEANYAIGHAQVVDVIGGTLSVAEGAPAYQSGEANCYCNFLNLSDGAQVVCPTWVRVGMPNKISAAACRWNVSGAAASRMVGGICLVGDNWEGDFEFQLNAEDATDDAAADFVVSGPLQTYSEIGGNPPSNRTDAMRVVKSGAGTVRFDGLFRPWTSLPTQIKGGTLAFGASGATTVAQNFELRGGSLEVADGTVNEMGTLRVFDSGKIVLGADATLAFADSSAFAWAEGKTIEIVGELKEHSLRFGTSAAGLTAAQRRQLAYGELGVKLDESGYVVPKDGGLMIFVR